MKNTVNGARKISSNCFVIYQKVKYSNLHYSVQLQCSSVLHICNIRPRPADLAGSCINPLREAGRGLAGGRAGRRRGCGEREVKLVLSLQAGEVWWGAEQSRRARYALARPSSSSERRPSPPAQSIVHQSLYSVTRTASSDGLVRPASTTAEHFTSGCSRLEICGIY